MDDGLRRRLSLTLLALAGVYVASSWSWAELAQLSIWPRLWPSFAPGPMPRDLAPYLAAAGWFLLLSGAVRPLRSMRDGSTEQQARFDLLILGFALLLAALGAWLEYRRYLTWDLSSMPPGFHNPFHVSLVVEIRVAFLALTLWVAWAISRSGVGNGVALIGALLAWTPEFPFGLMASFHELREMPPSAVPLAHTALLVAVAICVLYLRAEQALRLTPVGPQSGSPRRVVTFPLRWNLVGAAPLVMAAVLRSLFTFLFAVVAPGETMSARWFWLGSPGGWAFQTSLVVGLSILFTRLWFDTRQLARMLERWGYRLEEAGEAPVDQFLDGLLARRTLVSCAVLLALSFFPVEATWIWTGVPFPSALGGDYLLMVCAVIMDTARQITVRRSMTSPVPEALEAGQAPASRSHAASDEGSAPEAEEANTEGDSTPESPSEWEPDDEQGWSEVLETETELEARLAVAELESHGIRAVVLANRAVSLLGTLAVWEWCPPAYRALTFHRRLGGGRVVVMVPVPDETYAREVLEPRIEAPVEQTEEEAVPSEGTE